MNLSEEEFGFLSKEDLARLGELIAARKYHELLTFARNRMKLHPTVPAFAAVVGMCYNQLRKHDEARRFLEKQLDRFPNSSQLCFELGQAFLGLRESAEAEQAYRDAVDLADDDQQLLKSSYLTGLGGACWDQKKRDEALAYWREALELDPENQTAKAMVNTSTNEYGEAKAPAEVMDEMYHFQAIQTEKYLRERNTREFPTIMEATRVVGLIVKAWNADLAPRRDELALMSAAERSEIYAAVKVDFDAVSHPNEEEIAWPDDEDDDDDDEMIWQEGILPFLPEDAPAAMLFGSAALAAAGISMARLEEILQGAEPTEDEESKLEWAYDIVMPVFEATACRGTEDDIDAMMEAVATAREELEPEIAVAVVRAIRDVILEIASMEEKRSSKKKGKKRK
ncbi:MAG: tetratricopeptide repeat protein [Ignavibacteriae bacterium]|nr:tetratricopeptide repeat protein [Ignavibacteriota bacterium]